MSKKEWTAVVLVILVGIILQIPGGMGSQGELIGDRQASATVDPANPVVGPYRTVELDVTGMSVSGLVLLSTAAWAPPSPDMAHDGGPVPGLCP